MNIAESVDKMANSIDIIAQDGVPVRVEHNLTWQTGIILLTVVVGGILLAKFMPGRS